MAEVRIIPDRYTKDTFEPSRYVGLRAPPLPNVVIEICANAVALDLAGVVLDGEGNGGVGIWVHDCVDVAILNGTVMRFHYGIRAENVSNLDHPRLRGVGQREPIGCRLAARH